MNGQSDYGETCEDVVGVVTAPSAATTSMIGSTKDKITSARVAAVSFDIDDDPSESVPMIRTRRRSILWTAREEKTDAPLMSDIIDRIENGLPTSHHNDVSCGDLRAYDYNIKRCGPDAREISEYSVTDVDKYIGRDATKYRFVKTFNVFALMCHLHLCIMRFAVCSFLNSVFRASNVNCTNK